MFIMLSFFFFLWFYNHVQSLITFDTHGILSTPARDVHDRLKTNATAIKIARETTSSQ